MTNVIDNIRPDKKHFMLLGYGVTGKSLANWISSQGYSFFIFDDQAEVQSQLPGFLRQIKSVAEFTTTEWNELKMLVPSPGVALTHELVKEAYRHSVPVMGDLELAALQVSGDLIGVTSNVPIEGFSKRQKYRSARERINVPRGTLVCARDA